MVAGLEDVSEGEVLLGDEVVNDVDPGHRDVAMVFQNYALFPHMTVFENMAFPLGLRGASKRDATPAVADAAKLLGLTDYLRRRPSQLSGGQRQRVAMGRAIVRHPAAFLMDEPLSNLDAKLRTQMRAELGRLHRRLGVTTLYVTHDQTEAMTLGSRVAVMRAGLVQQVGTPQELYRRPANAFVARFNGSPPMNLMRGELDGGAQTVAGDDQSWRVDVSQRWRTGRREVIVGAHPEDWRPAPDGGGSGLALPAEVEVIEDLGAETLVYFSHSATPVGAVGDEQEVLDSFVARVSGETTIAERDRIAFHVDVAALHVFDAETGEALADE